MNAKYQANKDSLAVRMRREADEQSPAPSPLLHARIMQRIAKASAPVAARPAYSWRWPVAAALAAIITIVLLLHPWKSPDSISKPPKIAVSHPISPAPSIDSDVASLAQPATLALSEARYAYLDRDAEALAHYMIEQVNVTRPVR